VGEADQANDPAAYAHEFAESGIEPRIERLPWVDRDLEAQVMLMTSALTKRHEKLLSADLERTASRAAFAAHRNSLDC
jgi:hypothetical protein